MLTTPTPEGRGGGSTQKETMHPFHQVKEFHEKFDAYRSDKPELPADDVRKLRIALIEEEVKEFLAGEANNDLVEIADALADIIYVCCGCAVAYGIPLDKVIDEVHASNLSKLMPDGKPLVREDGKILKGPNYFKPRIKELLENLS